MPAQSLIIGVDLAPIKPIPRAITFQSDITSDKCRATIRQHLKTWKADTVLHDGAPNVGVAWVQDAYTQAELVLQSLKLATDFLVEGGTFVTKIFRSKDYNALLWVFKQLFTNVEATKPPSSRNVSAEIFVVCRGFKAPKKLDPRFLDPRHVFAEVQEPTPNNEAKVFNPEKKKRKREGYEEGDYTQHKEVPVSEFIHTTDPIAILGSVNKLSFEQKSNGDLALATLGRLPETTEEIRICCADLKVLGRKEFRTLLKWRLKIRDKFGMSAKQKKKEAAEAAAETAEAEEVAEVESMDEDMKIQEEMQKLLDSDTRAKRKDRRKENERKQKEIFRMQMHMTTPHDIGLEQIGPNGDGAMFNAKTASRAEDALKRGRMQDLEKSESSDDEEQDQETDDEEDRLDRELDTLYENYQQRKEDQDAKQRAKRARKEKETDEWGGLSGPEKEDGSDAGSETEARLPMRPPSNSQGLSSKAAMFFDQDIFQGLGIADPTEANDSAIELDDDSDRAAGKLEKEQTETAASHPQPKSTPKAGKTSQSKSKPIDLQKQQEEADCSEEDESPKPPKSAPTAAAAPEDPRKSNGQLDIDLITAEAMTLAHSLATGAKTSTDLIDDGFNKYAFRDVDGLPDWFLDDETKHSHPQRPVTAAAAAAIKEKLRALNARPIKKVREAKGRKKFKAAQRLEKLRKKSSLLVEDESSGMSEKDKAGAVARMMSRATKNKKPKQGVKLVVARGGNKGIAGRPRGVKGKYKIVDKRLKKDVRGEKRAAKKGKK